MPKFTRTNPGNALYPTYLIEGLPLATRSLMDHPDWGDDDWKFIDKGSSLAAVFSTFDGEDFEEIAIDISDEPQPGAYCPGKTLFERVHFTHQFVSKSLEARQECEDEAETAARYIARYSTRYGAKKPIAENDEDDNENALAI